MKVMASAQGHFIAVVDHNEPVFYCVPTDAYEVMLDRLEDMELLELAKSRADKPSVKMTLDE